MALPAHRIESFAEFWPYYVAEHQRVGCRLLHYLGAMAAIGTLVAAVTLQLWWLLLLVPVAGYGLAWTGHFFIERNQPATWSYVRWSLVGEYKMLWFGLTGRMAREVARLTPPPASPPAPRAPHQG